MERLQLTQAIILLPFIHIALVLLGYSRLQEMLVRIAGLLPKSESRSGAENLRQAREISGIVSIAAQHGMFKATCLRRSILVWWLLLRKGIPSRICFGVSMLNQRLEAHAWVELEGIIINDSADVRDRYCVLENEPPPTRTGL
jgi:hypothetical protein